MATIDLKAERRVTLGKQGAKHTRGLGRVPAVLYGEGKENITLSVDALEVKRALATPSGRNVIVRLGIEDEDGMTRVIFRDVSRDAVTRDILHVDFMRISENRPINMRIPVVVVGESPAVKEGRGLLDHTMRHVEVKCLPKDIPESIEVDVSKLDVKHAIHVGDIEIPNVEILDLPERPVVEVLQPTIFKEAEEGEEAAVEGEKAPAEGKEAPTESEEKAEE